VLQHQPSQPPNPPPSHERKDRLVIDVTKDASVTDKFGPQYLWRSLRSVIGGDGSGGGFGSPPG
jgi:hypothetical protein